MRIIIDFQGAQADSRYRGIGQYTKALVHAIVKENFDHEIYLVLNGVFTESILPIKTEYEHLLPATNICIWYPISPAYGGTKQNIENRKLSEKIYEHYILDLKPDIVLVTNIFESHNYGNDAITTINIMKNKTCVAVILYDLIPLLNPQTHLSNISVKNWYFEKLDYLKKADLLLAISESARMEGINNLDIHPDNIINISSAVSDIFIPMDIQNKSKFLAQYNILKPFLMHTAGLDERKNVKGLIEAYARLPIDIRNEHQLVIVFSLDNATKSYLIDFSKSHGLQEGELIFTGFVSDTDLVVLYNLCKLFIFPSFHEGFGLPPLEAMSCGCATIASNTSSLPEVIGRKDALFDPYSMDDMSKKMLEVLTNEQFRLELKNFALKQAKLFSWSINAKKALSAMDMGTKKLVR